MEGRGLAPATADRAVVCERLVVVAARTGRIAGGLGRLADQAL
jgi:hypothetical protein